MISIQNLSKTYPGNVHALDNINLEIGLGMFGLVGPNGAGKTTLMRILAGLLKPTHGKVTVFGHNMSQPAAKQSAKAMLGYLPQELGLYPHLTAGEFLDYVAVLKGVLNPDVRRRQIADVLDIVRLTDASNRQLKTFSGGMKRRVGIAQTLLGAPKLLIVDEPTSGLDPEERVRLRNVLADMAQRCTVILSTHIIEDISQSCNDLAILYQGRVIFHQSPLNLITAARGHVWTVTANGDRPQGDIVIISTLPTTSGVQYRLIGQPDARYSAVSTEPTLEDGYIWMMKSR